MRIRNNNWINLRQLDDDKLKEVAAEKHIDPYYIVIDNRSEPNEKLGRMVTKTIRIRKERTRRTLIDMVEHAMTLFFDVPSESWTEEQSDLYKERGIFDIKDGAKEAEEKRKIGIQIALRDEAEVPEEVAELMMEHFNTARRLATPTKKDANGKIIQTARWENVKRNWIEEVKEEEEVVKGNNFREEKKGKKVKGEKRNRVIEEEVDEDTASMI